MAETVFKQEDILIGEDSDIQITIRRNTIARQRRVMAQWDSDMKAANDQIVKIQEEIERAKKAEEEPDEKLVNALPDNFDAYVTLAALCIEKAVAEVYEGPVFTASRKVTKEFRAWVEENIDELTLLHIIEVCSGMDLSPENLMRQLQTQA